MTIQRGFIMPKTLTKNECLEILGLPSNATKKEIRKKYYQLIRAAHPDRSSTESLARSQELNEAYETLMDKNLQYESGRNELCYGYELTSNDYFAITMTSDDTYQKLIKKDSSYIKLFNYTKIIQFPKKLKTTFDPFRYEPKIHFWLERTFGISENNITKYDIPMLVDKTAFLWKAEKDGCGTVYLASLMHITPEDYLQRFSPFLNQMISYADRVYCEIKMDVYAYDIHEVRNKKSVGYSEFFSLEKSDSEEEKVDIFYSTDRKFIQMAINQGKEISYLESEAIVSQMMKQTPEPAYGTEDYQKKSLRWNYEDAESIYFQSFLSINAPEASPLTINRNIFWMSETILPDSRAGKNIVVGPGAGHNCGKYGLPNLLAVNGYRLTPLITSVPPHASEIVRELAFGRSPFSFLRKLHKIAEDDTEVSRYKNS